MDVRDLVRGLWMSSECCEAGEVYNLGGCRIYSVEELIEAIRSHLKVGFSIQQDPVLMRACDEPVIAGDTTKFRACSGWEPEIELGRYIARHARLVEGAPCLDGGRSEPVLPGTRAGGVALHKWEWTDQWRLQ